MQTRHDVPDDLRYGCRHLGVRFFICSAQSDKTVSAFQFFRFIVGDSEFLADLECDRMTGNRDDTDEETAVVDKDQRGATSADIQNHFAVGIAHSVRPCRIVTGGRRNFDQHDLFSETFQNPCDFVYFFIFDDDEHRFDFTAVVRGTDQLGIPYHLIHRERNRIFRFKFNDLLDFFLVIDHCRDFDKLDV